MKIRGFIIAGVILLGSGIGITAYAASRDDFDKEGFGSGDISYVEYNYDKNSINKICIDSYSDSVSIVATDREDIYVKSKELGVCKYDVSMDDTTLNIKFQGYSFFRNLFTFKWNNYMAFSKTKFIVEVPKDIVYNYEIDLSAGTLELLDINANTLELDINATTATIGSLNAENVVSSINATTATFNNSEIKKMTGDINSSTVTYNGVIKEEGSFDINASTMIFKFNDSKDNYSINDRKEGLVNLKIESSVSTVDYHFDSKN